MTQSVRPRKIGYAYSDPHPNDLTSLIKFKESEPNIKQKEILLELSPHKRHQKSFESIQFKFFSSLECFSRMSHEWFKVTTQLDDFLKKILKQWHIMLLFPATHALQSGFNAKMYFVSRASFKDSVRGKYNFKGICFLRI